MAKAKPKPKPHWKGGTIYKNGKLYVFEPQSLVVMSPWPDPRTWYKTPDQPWISSRTRADEALCDFRNSEEETQDIYLFEMIDNRNIDRDVRNHDQTRKFMSDHRPLLAADPSDEKNTTAREYKKWKESILSDIGNADLHPMDKRHMNAYAYLQNIPQPQRAIIDALKSRKWHMLCFLARVDGALELSQSNVALAYALSSIWAFKKHPVKNHFRSVRALMGKKQTEILSWLDFPPSRFMRKTLQKMRANDLSVPALLKIRKLVTKGEHKKFISHLSVFDSYMANMLMSPYTKTKITKHFLEEFCWHNDKNYIYRRIIDIVERCNSNRLEIPYFTSIESVYDHDFNMNDRIIEKRLSKVRSLPPPPYPGTKNIIPIQSPKELKKEGFEMKNCVFQYAFRILRSEQYVYRVSSPVRATASIINAEDKWRPGETELEGNEPVDPATRELIFSELFGSHPKLKGALFQLPLFNNVFFYAIHKPYKFSAD